MKITDIETILLRQPEVKLIGDGTQDVLILKIYTDEDIVGIGEVHTAPYIAKAVIEAPSSHIASRGLKEILIGENPLDIEVLWKKMYEGTVVYGRRGVAIHAISGIDIALWDILGKYLNQPIYTLLGGSFREEVPVYASVLMPNSPKQAADLAENMVKEGFSAIKFGWGGLLDEDTEKLTNFVRTIRDIVGPEVDLMIDIGQPLELHQAIELAQRLEEYKVYFLEEPLSPDHLKSYAKLREKASVKITAGEKESTKYGFQDLIDHKAVDIIQPDLARAGGFTEVRKIHSYASIRGIDVIPHCWSTDILVAATLHMIASMPDCRYLEYAVVDTPLRKFVTEHPIQHERGTVQILDGPGLGVELNQETINKYR